MRRAFLPAVLILLCAGTVFAQAGALCVYADPNGTNCYLEDTAPGLVTYYVVHTLTPGATAVQFKAPMPACMTGATWLSDTGAWPVTVGDSQTGVSVAYGTCQAGPILVLSINYQMSGTTPSGCAYPVLPIDSDDYIPVVDCANEVTHINGGVTFFGAQTSCQCDENPAPPIIELSAATMVITNGQPSAQVDVLNAGGGTMNWSVLSKPVWATVIPATGTGPQTVTVTGDETLVGNGTHEGDITFGTTGSSAKLHVYFSVEDLGPPVLSVSPTLLDYGLSTTSLGLTIQNVGGSELTWYIVENISWFTPSQTSGTHDVTLSCVVNRNGLSPGHYEDTFDVMSNGGEVTVTVSMDVPTPMPILYVYPLTIDFGTALNSDHFEISNAGTGDLNWTVSESASWLSLNRTAGLNYAQVTATVDRTGLSDGHYTTGIDITSNGGNATVTVEMDVYTNPLLQVDPVSLAFPLSVDLQFLYVSNHGASPLIWNATVDQPWISLAPDSGVTDPGSTTPTVVTVDRSGLPDGTHNANIYFDSNGGNQSVPVTVEVSTIPTLYVTPTILTFSSGGTKSFSISNIGGGTLNWSVGANMPWISVNPTYGTEDASVLVTVDGGLAPEGNADGLVSVTSNGGNQDVSIRWRPAPSGTPGALGVFGDQQGTQGCIGDPGVAGLVTFYVVHMFAPGVTASSFAAPIPQCWTGAIWIADTPPFPVTIGNSQTGVSIGYGACYPSPVSVLAINVFTQGVFQGLECCPYAVVPNPSAPSGHIEVVDCLENLLYGFGLTTYVGLGSGCTCGSVNVEESTWGRIKSIYAGDEGDGQ